MKNWIPGTTHGCFRGLHYLTCGKGRPIILLHGIGANTFVWRYVAPILAKGLSVYIIDLKGHGQSEKPADERYSLDDHAGLILEFIRALNLHEVSLVGHSFGGGVALLVALRLIDTGENRLLSIALLDSVGFRQRVPRYFRFLTLPVVSYLFLLVAPAKLVIRAVLHDVYFDRGRIDSETVCAYADNLESAAGIRAVILTARQLLAADVEIVSTRYKEITVPVLLIWGRQDRLVPLSVAESFKDRLVNSELILIDRCGHNPQEERPEIVGIALTRFLDGLHLPLDRCGSGADE